jgi:hypothetical protein
MVAVDAKQGALVRQPESPATSGCRLLPMSGAWPEQALCQLLLPHGVVPPVHQRIAPARFLDIAFGTLRPVVLQFNAPQTMYEPP